MNEQEYYSRYEYPLRAAWNETLNYYKLIILIENNELKINVEEYKTTDSEKSYQKYIFDNKIEYIIKNIDEITLSLKCELATELFDFINSSIKAHQKEIKELNDENNLLEKNKKLLNPLFRENKITKILKNIKK